MKLKDKLKEMPENEVLYIGAESSFFFIGTKSEFFKDLDFLRKEFIRMAVNRMNDYINTRRRIQKDGLIQLEADIESPSEKWRRRCDFTYNTLLSMDARIKNLQNYLDNFTDFDTREVLDVRNRDCCGDGTIIIVDGAEIGFYWFLHEYQKAKERNQIGSFKQ